MSKIIKAEAYHIKLPTKFPFTTSFGDVIDRETIIVKLTTDGGIIGYGESAPLTQPVYLEEDIETCKHIIGDILFPIILGKTLKPEQFVEKTNYIRANRIAKYGVECALWDIQSQEENKPITKLLGSTKQTIDIGESIGLLPSTTETIKLIQKRLDQGYKRIKLKISPGHDLKFLKDVRKEFPNITLMADANSAYTLKDISLFKKIDKLNLLMIEQPLGFDDIIDHQKLQREIKTPICLDESIVSYEHAKKAIELKSCKIINVKPGRIGSLVETKRINQLAKENNIKLWCGGMLEAGVANAYNLYVASLSEFYFPADIFLSEKIFKKDIIKKPIDFITKGEIQVPQGIGLGFEVENRLLKKYLLSKIYQKM